mgnify:CR=1 FL=1
MTWVFGYGSLIWRPGFPFLQRERAVLLGYERRFWQGSPDHRGTPTEPGRVVTLAPRPTARCEGVAFLVADEHRQEVLSALDVRESGGYVREIRTIQLAANMTADAVVYIAHVDNPSYLGPASIEVMAEHISSSRGPSGSNIDYVLNLKDILDKEGIHDEHLNALAGRLRA